MQFMYAEGQRREGRGVDRRHRVPEDDAGPEYPGQ